MNSEFLVDDNLKSISNSHLEKCNSDIEELKTINKELENLLEDNKWEGEKHDVCVAAIGMMEQYRADLENICKELKNCVDSVVSDAGNFENVSDKVAAIKKV